MSSEPDDEGLHWDGDVDRATTPVSRVRYASRAAEGLAPVAPGAPGAPETPVSPGARGAGESVMLVLYGVFAGIALLYTIAWLMVVLSFSRSGVFADPLPAIMYQLRLWLAVAAPALWGASVLLIIDRKYHLKRLVWLALGALLLVPWPYLGMGAA